MGVHLGIQEPYRNTALRGRLAQVRFKLPLNPTVPRLVGRKEGAEPMHYSELLVLALLLDRAPISGLCNGQRGGTCSAEARYKGLDALQVSDRATSTILCRRRTSTYT